MISQLSSSCQLPRDFTHISYTCNSDSSHLPVFFLFPLPLSVPLLLLWFLLLFLKFGISSLHFKAPHPPNISIIADSSSSLHVLYFFPLFLFHPFSVLSRVIRPLLSFNPQFSFTSSALHLIQLLIFLRANMHPCSPWTYTSLKRTGIEKEIKKKNMYWSP